MTNNELIESLQKRYTTEHNEKMCERVADALEALRMYNRLTHDLGASVYEKVLDKFSEMITDELVTIASFKLELTNWDTSMSGRLIDWSEINVL